MFGPVRPQAEIEAARRRAENGGHRPIVWQKSSRQVASACSLLKWVLQPKIAKNSPKIPLLHRLYIVTDMLLIITSTVGGLFSFINIYDRERPWNPQKGVFGEWSSYRRFVFIAVWEMLAVGLEGRTFRHYDVSPPGRLAPSLDVSPPGRFVLKTFHPQDVSPPGRFALRTFRTQDVSHPGRFSTWTFRPQHV